MTEQPEALRHAEWLELSLAIGAQDAAAELRRLHASLHTETLAKLSALERLEQAHKSEVTAKTRIAALEDREQHWMRMHDVEAARVDPLVARVMALEKALEMAVKALELEDLACRYEKDPTPDHIAKAIATARQTLGGKHD